MLDKQFVDFILCDECGSCWSKC